MSNSGGGAFLPNEATTISGPWTFSGATTFSGQTVQTGAATTAVNVGTVGGATITAVESGNGFFHQTVLTLTNTPITLVDANVGGGVLIYTFPKGRISIYDASASVAPTTTSAIASTLNSGVTLSVGVGSVITTTQGSGTLTTTQQDIVNAFAGTSSTTINVAAAVVVGKISATTLIRYDGTSTATVANLNCQVGTATDIDADATTTWSGTVTMLWTFNGTV
jgi:hypothetical protein